MTVRDESDYAALLGSYDPFNPEHVEWKYDAFKYARQKCPVAHTDAIGGFHIITRYEDVRRVCEDWETFSSVDASPMPSPLTLTPLMIDPPLQQDVKKLLNPLFSRTFGLRYEEDMRRNAQDLIDGWIDDGEVEILSQFAGPFVSRFLAQMAFAEADEEKMAKARDIVMRVAEEGTPESFFDLSLLSAEYLAAAQDNPPEEDGVLHRLVTARIDGRPLAEELQLGAVALIFLGGLDTTRSAMGAIALQVAQHPELEERIRNPRWVRHDMDEFIRWASPVGTFGRVVTRDVEVNGVQMRKGDKVLVRFDSANRDDEQFPNADELQFDPPRGANAGFGLGVHRCLGSHLARLQIQIAFEELYKRVTNFRLACDPADIEWIPGIANAPVGVPLHFDRVAQ